MPHLIRFLLESFATGALIGLLTAAGVIASMTGFGWVVEEPLSAGLFAWGFSSTFGLGYVATALTAGEG